MDVQTYLFLPQDRDRSALDLSYEGLFASPEHIEADQETRAAQESESYPKLPSYPTTNNVFRYNPLHDMESLWWIAVYFVVRRQPCIDDQEQAWNLSDPQRILIKDLFHDKTSTIRERFLKHADYFNTKMGCLHEDIRFIIKWLDGIRILLCNAYAEVEENVSAIDASASCLIRASFKLFLEGIVDSLKSKEICMVPLGNSPFAADSKAGEDPELDSDQDNDGGDDVHPPQNQQTENSEGEIDYDAPIPAPDFSAGIKRARTTSEDSDSSDEEPLRTKVNSKSKKLRKASF